MPCIGDVRGLGAMVAFELVKDPTTKEPDAELTASILAHAEKRGLILLSCGTEANVVRLLAPLTIPDAVLEEGLNILAAAVKDATGGSRRARWREADRDSSPPGHDASAPCGAEASLSFTGARWP